MGRSFPTLVTLDLEWRRGPGVGADEEEGVGEFSRSKKTSQKD